MRRGTVGDTACGNGVGAGPGYGREILADHGARNVSHMVVKTRRLDSRVDLTRLIGHLSGQELVGFTNETPVPHTRHHACASDVHPERAARVERIGLDELA